MEMRARQERDRMLHRMRGPEGDEARRTGRVQNGPRLRGPAPLVQRPALSHAQRQQQLLYHDSPQVPCLLAMNLFYVRLRLFSWAQFTATLRSSSRGLLCSQNRLLLHSLLPRCPWPHKCKDILIFLNLLDILQIPIHSTSLHSHQSWLKIAMLLLLKAPRVKKTAIRR